MPTLPSRGLVAALALAVLPLPASAQLIVDKLWMDIDSTSPSSREDVVVRNEGSMTYYISVVPAEIKSPGTPTEARVETENPEELGLLVSPNRLVLEPGTSRALRIVSINEPLERERIYRVRITPKVGEIAAGPTEGEDRGINLVLLTAYDLLVTVRPADPKLDIRSAREGGELVVSNAGNTNTLLVDGQACVGTTCTPLTDARLYAGGTVRYPLPHPEAKVQIKSRDRAGGRDRELNF